MRNVILVITSALVMSVSGSASGVTGGALTLDRAKIDLGRIPSDNRVKVEVLIKNTGNTAVSIKSVTPSCGCTVVRIGKRQLDPGELTELTVELDPSDFNGKVEKTVRILSDAPTSPETTLTLTADVIAAVGISAKLVSFPAVSRSGTAMSTIRLTSGNGKPVRITGVTGPKIDYLTLEAGEEDKDATLDIGIDGGKVPIAANAGMERITILAMQDKPMSFPVTVRWEVADPFIVTPPAVALNGRKNEKRSAQVTLKRRDGKPFRVLTWKSDDPSVTVSGASFGSTESFVLTMDVTCPERVGAKQALVTIVTDAKDQPEIPIRIAIVVVDDADRS
jgi:hypothetical protein